MEESTAEVETLRRQITHLREGVAVCEARFQSIVERSSDGVLVVGDDGIIRFANPAAEALLGRRRQDLVGTGVTFPIAVGEVTEIELVQPDQHVAYAETRVVATVWEGRPASLALLREVTVRHSVEAQLARRATHDALTGLPNRDLLEDRLTQALARVERNAHPLTVFYVDLDDFKAVNDLFGHGTGDQVLIEAASRIRAVMRPADTAARVGGDEFVLLCETMEATAADAFMGRLRAAFREPIVAGAVEITLRLSAGMATTDDSAVTPASLIANADRAMYQAKRNEAPDNV
jgi:diguanylate cyclase (GGDEF)-like protein